VGKYFLPYKTFGATPSSSAVASLSPSEGGDRSEEEAGKKRKKV
jgi:hypothetical protein